MVTTGNHPHQPLLTETALCWGQLVQGQGAWVFVTSKPWAPREDACQPQQAGVALLEDD